MSDSSDISARDENICSVISVHDEWSNVVGLFYQLKQLLDSCNREVQHSWAIIDKVKESASIISLELDVFGKEISDEMITWSRDEFNTYIGIEPYCDHLLSSLQRKNLLSTTVSEECGTNETSNCDTNFVEYLSNTQSVNESEESTKPRNTVSLLDSNRSDSISIDKQVSLIKPLAVEFNAKKQSHYDCVFKAIYASPIFYETPPKISIQDVRTALNSIYTPNPFRTIRRFQSMDDRYLRRKLIEKNIYPGRDATGEPPFNLITPQNYSYSRDRIVTIVTTNYDSRFDPNNEIENSSSDLGLDFHVDQECDDCYNIPLNSYCYSAFTDGENEMLKQTNSQLNYCSSVAQKAKVVKYCEFSDVEVTEGKESVSGRVKSQDPFKNRVESNSPSEVKFVATVIPDKKDGSTPDKMKCSGCPQVSNSDNSSLKSSASPKSDNSANAKRWSDFMNSSQTLNDKCKNVCASYAREKMLSNVCGFERKRIQAKCINQNTILEEENKCECNKDNDCIEVTLQNYPIKCCIQEGAPLTGIGDTSLIICAPTTSRGSLKSPCSSCSTENLRLLRNRSCRRSKYLSCTRRTKNDDERRCSKVLTYNCHQPTSCHEPRTMADYGCYETLLEQVHLNCDGNQPCVQQSGLSTDSERQFTAPEAQRPHIRSLDLCKRHNDGCYSHRKQMVIPCNSNHLMVVPDERRSHRCKSRSRKRKKVSPSFSEEMMTAADAHIRAHIRAGDRATVNDLSRRQQKVLPGSDHEMACSAEQRNQIKCIDLPKRGKKRKKSRSGRRKKAPPCNSVEQMTVPDDLHAHIRPLDRSKVCKVRSHSRRQPKVLPCDSELQITVPDERRAHIRPTLCHTKVCEEGSRSRPRRQPKVQPCGSDLQITVADEQRAHLRPICHPKVCDDGSHSRSRRHQWELRCESDQQMAVPDEQRALVTCIDQSQLCNDRCHSRSRRQLRKLRCKSDQQLTVPDELRAHVNCLDQSQLCNDRCHSRSRRQLRKLRCNSDQQLALPDELRAHVSCIDQSQLCNDRCHSRPRRQPKELRCNSDQQVALPDELRAHVSCIDQSQVCDDRCQSRPRRQPRELRCNSDQQVALPDELRAHVSCIDQSQVCDDRCQSRPRRQPRELRCNSDQQVALPDELRAHVSCIDQSQVCDDRCQSRPCRQRRELRCNSDQQLAVPDDLKAHVSCMDQSQVCNDRCQLLSRRQPRELRCNSDQQLAVCDEQRARMRCPDQSRVCSDGSQLRRYQKVQPCDSDQQCAVSDEQRAYVRCIDQSQQCNDRSRSRPHRQQMVSPCDSDQQCAVPDEQRAHIRCPDRSRVCSDGSQLRRHQKVQPCDSDQQCAVPDEQRAHIRCIDQSTVCNDGSQSRRQMVQPCDSDQHMAIPEEQIVRVRSTGNVCNLRSKSRKQRVQPCDSVQSVHDDQRAYKRSIDQSKVCSVGCQSPRLKVQPCDSYMAFPDEQRAHIKPIDQSKVCLDRTHPRPQRKVLPCDSDQHLAIPKECSNESQLCRQQSVLPCNSDQQMNVHDAQIAHLRSLYLSRRGHDESQSGKQQMVPPWDSDHQVAGPDGQRARIKSKHRSRRHNDGSHSRNQQTDDPCDSDQLTAHERSHCRLDRGKHENQSHQSRRLPKVRPFDSDLLMVNPNEPLVEWDGSHSRNQQTVDPCDSDLLTAHERSHCKLDRRKHGNQSRRLPRVRPFDSDLRMVDPGEPRYLTDDGYFATTPSLIKSIDGSNTSIRPCTSDQALTHGGQAYITGDGCFASQSHIKSKGESNVCCYGNKSRRHHRVLPCNSDQQVAISDEQRCITDDGYFATPPQKMSKDVSQSTDDLDQACQLIKSLERQESKVLPGKCYSSQTAVGCSTEYCNIGTKVNKCESAHSRKNLNLRREFSTEKTNRKHHNFSNRVSFNREIQHKFKKGQTDCPKIPCSIIKPPSHKVSSTNTSELNHHNPRGVHFNVSSGRKPKVHKSYHVYPHESLTELPNLKKTAKADMNVGTFDPKDISFEISEVNSFDTPDDSCATVKLVTPNNELIRKGRVCFSKDDRKDVISISRPSQTENELLKYAKNLQRTKYAELSKNKKYSATNSPQYDQDDEKLTKDKFNDSRVSMSVSSVTMSDLSDNKGTVSFKPTPNLVSNKATEMSDSSCKIDQNNDNEQMTTQNNNERLKTRKDATKENNSTVQKQGNRNKKDFISYNKTMLKKEKKSVTFPSRNNSCLITKNNKICTEDEHIRDSKLKSKCEIKKISKPANNYKEDDSFLEPKTDNYNGRNKNTMTKDVLDQRKDEYNHRNKHTYTNENNIGAPNPQTDEEKVNTSTSIESYLLRGQQQLYNQNVSIKTLRDISRQLERERLASRRKAKEIDNSQSPSHSRQDACNFRSPNDKTNFYHRASWRRKYTDEDIKRLRKQSKISVFHSTVKNRHTRNTIGTSIDELILNRRLSSMKNKHKIENKSSYSGLRQLFSKLVNLNVLPNMLGSNDEDQSNPSRWQRTKDSIINMLFTDQGTKLSDLKSLPDLNEVLCFDFNESILTCKSDANIAKLIERHNASNILSNEKKKDREKGKKAEKFYYPNRRRKKHDPKEKDISKFNIQTRKPESATLKLSGIKTEQKLTCSHNELHYVQTVTDIRPNKYKHFRPERNIDGEKDKARKEKKPTSKGGNKDYTNSSKIKEARIAANVQKSKYSKNLANKYLGRNSSSKHFKTSTRKRSSQENNIDEEPSSEVKLKRDKNNGPKYVSKKGPNFSERMTENIPSELRMYQPQKVKKGLKMNEVEMATSTKKRLLEKYIRTCKEKGIPIISTKSTKRLLGKHHSHIKREKFSNAPAVADSNFSFRDYIAQQQALCEAEIINIMNTLSEKEGQGKDENELKADSRYWIPECHIKLLKSIEQLYSNDFNSDTNVAKQSGITHSQEMNQSESVGNVESKPSETNDKKVKDESIKTTISLSSETKVDEKQSDTPIKIKSSETFLDISKILKRNEKSQSFEPQKSKLTVHNLPPSCEMSSESSNNTYLEINHESKIEDLNTKTETDKIEKTPANELNEKKDETNNDEDNINLSNIKVTSESNSNDENLKHFESKESTIYPEGINESHDDQKENEKEHSMKGNLIKNVYKYINESLINFKEEVKRDISAINTTVQPSIESQEATKTSDDPEIINHAEKTESISKKGKKKLKVSFNITNDVEKNCEKDMKKESKECSRKEHKTKHGGKQIECKIARKTGNQNNLMITNECVTKNVRPPKRCKAYQNVNVFTCDIQNSHKIEEANNQTIIKTISNNGKTIENQTTIESFKKITKTMPRRPPLTNKDFEHSEKRLHSSWNNYVKVSKFSDVYEVETLEIQKIRQEIPQFSKSTKHTQEELSQIRKKRDTYINKLNSALKVCDGISKKPLELDDGQLSEYGANKGFGILCDMHKKEKIFKRDSSVQAKDQNRKLLDEDQIQKSKSSHDLKSLNPTSFESDQFKNEESTEQNGPELILPELTNNSAKADGKTSENTCTELVLKESVPNTVEANAQENLKITNSDDQRMQNDNSLNSGNNEVRSDLRKSQDSKRLATFTEFQQEISDIKRRMQFKLTKDRLLSQIEETKKPDVTTEKSSDKTKKISNSTESVDSLQFWRQLEKQSSITSTPNEKIAFDTCKTSSHNPFINSVSKSKTCKYKALGDLEYTKTGISLNKSNLTSIVQAKPALHIGEEDIKKILKSPSRQSVSLFNRQFDAFTIRNQWEMKLQNGDIVDQFRRPPYKCCVRKRGMYEKTINKWQTTPSMDEMQNNSKRVSLHHKKSEKSRRKLRSEGQKSLEEKGQKQSNNPKEKPRKGFTNFTMPIEPPKQQGVAHSSIFHCFKPLDDCEDLLSTMAKSKQPSQKTKTEKTKSNKNELLRKKLKTHSIAKIINKSSDRKHNSVKAASSKNKHPKTTAKGDYGQTKKCKSPPSVSSVDLSEIRNLLSLDFKRNNIPKSTVDSFLSVLREFTVTIEDHITLMKLALKKENLKLVSKFHSKSKNQYSKERSRELYKHLVSVEKSSKQKMCGDCDSTSTSSPKTMSLPAKYDTPKELKKSDSKFKVTQTTLEYVQKELVSLKSQINQALFEEVRNEIASNSSLSKIEIDKVLQSIDSELDKIKSLEKQIDLILRELKKRIEVEGELDELHTRFEKDFVSKFEYECSKLSQDEALKKLKHDTITETKTQLNDKLNEINELIQHQIQEQSRLEKARNNSEISLRKKLEHIGEVLQTELNNIQSVLTGTPPDLKENNECIKEEVKGKDYNRRRNVFEKSCSLDERQGKGPYKPSETSPKHGGSVVKARQSLEEKMNDDLKDKYLKKK